jgi:hypothetical protein
LLDGGDKFELQVTCVAVVWRRGGMGRIDRRTARILGNPNFLHLLVMCATRRDLAQSQAWLTAPERPEQLLGAVRLGIPYANVAKKDFT